MPIEAHALLTYAKQLRSGDRSEVELRTSASRAYYSALHTVDNTFAVQGPKVNGRNESSHDQIIGKALHHARTGAAGKSDAAMIAKLMPQIKRFRVKADYEIESTFDKTDVDSLLDRAIDVCRRCISVATQIKNAESKADDRLQPISVQAPQVEEAPPPKPTSPGGSTKPALRRIR